jgi:hypothetical protein
VKKLLSFFILASYAVMPLHAQTFTTTTNTVTTTQSQRITPKVINPYGLTTAEMQELAVAREEAMKANPALTKDSMQLRQKMHDFQSRLDQAILQADPNVSPVVSTIERGPGAPLPTHPALPTSSPSIAPSPPQSR